MIITVFTPTYNRAYILKNLFNSLKNQTFQNFEWIIVDDGSTDNTEEVVKEWLNESLFFKIKYHKQKNGGKHTAINKGLELASGDVFFIIDSDDYITNDALFKINSWSQEVYKDNSFWGVSGNRAKPNGTLIGTTFLEQYKDCYYAERENNNIKGDKAEAFFMKIIKNYRFPVFEGEKFMTEKVFFLEFGQKYKMRFHNSNIYIGDYLNDGLSKNMQSIEKKSPKGLAYVGNREIEVLNRTIKDKLSFYYYYYRDFKNILSLDEIKNNLNITTFTLLLSIIIFSTLNFLRKKN